VKRANGCKCGRMLASSDDPMHCFWCGHGPCVLPAYGRAIRMRRLPRDLGAIQREGKRPDPLLENVVRLDRLRDGWKVPPVSASLRLVETLAGDWPDELREAA
jgi:hypothetical protein